MSREVVYVIQVEFPDYDNDNDYLDVRDEIQDLLENAVDMHGVHLINSDIESEEVIE